MTRYERTLLKIVESSLTFSLTLAPSLYIHGASMADSLRYRAVERTKRGMADSKHAWMVVRGGNVTIFDEYVWSWSITKQDIWWVGCTRRNQCVEPDLVHQSLSLRQCRPRPWMEQVSGFGISPFGCSSRVRGCLVPLRREQGKGNKQPYFLSHL